MFLLQARAVDVLRRDQQDLHAADRGREARDVRTLTVTHSEQSAALKAQRPAASLAVARTAAQLRVLGGTRRYSAVLTASGQALDRADGSIGWHSVGLWFCLFAAVRLAPLASTHRDFGVL